MSSLPLEEGDDLRRRDVGSGDGGDLLMSHMSAKVGRGRVRDVMESGPK